MSIVFSDNFDTGSATGWTGHPTIPTSTMGMVNCWGVDNTYATGCSNGFAAKKFGSRFGPNGAIRAQVAAILGAGTSAVDGGILWQIIDYASASVGLGFYVIVYLRPDGSFRIRYNTTTIFVASFLNTAAGLFPVDGTWFGLQVRWVVGATTTVTFTVNNVDVATISFADGAHPVDGWDCVVLDNYFINSPRSNTLVDNFELDDSSAAVSWPATLTAPQMSGTLTCSVGPFPASVVTGIAAVGSSQLSITGTNFQDPLSVLQVEDPEGRVMTYTIVSITSTEILLEDLVPSLVDGGEYCVVVASPCTHS